MPIPAAGGRWTKFSLSETFGEGRLNGGKVLNTCITSQNINPNLFQPQNIMRYLIAIFLPFVAILLCGKPFLALFSFIAQCTIIGWIPASIHAFVVIGSHKGDVRTKAVTDAINQQTNEMRSSMNAHSKIAARQAKAQIATQMATAAQLAQSTVDARQSQQMPVKQIEETRFQVSRNEKVMGSWTKSEIHDFSQKGNLVSGDWVWNAEANSWQTLEQFLAN